MTTTDSVSRPGKGPGTGHPEPVFILSPPRSFSTVTLALLAGHPSIFGFPEMLAFANERVSDLIGDDGTEAERFPPEYRRTRLSGVFRGIAQVHERVQTPEALERAHAWLRARTDWPMTRVMDALLDRIGPLIGTEKSPDTVATDESLARCLNHYPKARYIHLTRHPVTTQRSMQEQNPQYLTDRKVRAVGAATSWYTSHRRILASLSSLPDEQWMRVRGEDLLTDPALWARRIADWLGVESGDETIDQMLHPESWSFAGNGPSGGLYGGDHKFLSNPRLRPVPDPGPVRFDPAWGLLEEMHTRMADLAHELGY